MGLTFGALLLILFGHAIIEGRNPEFRQFVPSPVSVELFASLVIAFGMVAAAAGLRQDIDALTATY